MLPLKLNNTAENVLTSYLDALLGAVPPASVFNIPNKNSHTLTTLSQYNEQKLHSLGGYLNFLCLLNLTLQLPEGRVYQQVIASCREIYET